MLKGSSRDLEVRQFGMILGNELAMQLGVRVGDKVMVIAPEFSVTPIGALPRSKRFEVVGMFSVGFAEYDTGVGIVHMDDAQKLFPADGPSGVRIRLDDMFGAWQIARGLRDRIEAISHHRPGNRATRTSSAR